MDQHEPRRAGGRRGVQRVGQRGPVGKSERVVLRRGGCHRAFVTEEIQGTW